MPARAARSTTALPAAVTASLPFSVSGSVNATAAPAPSVISAWSAHIAAPSVKVSACPVVCTSSCIDTPDAGRAMAAPAAGRSAKRTTAGAAGAASQFSAAAHAPPTAFVQVATASGAAPASTVTFPFAAVKVALGAPSSVQPVTSGASPV